MALTKAGLDFLVQAAVGQGIVFDAANARLAVGNGRDAFDISQVDLQGTSTFRKGLDEGYPLVDPPKVTFKATFGPEDANFEWNEWGIFNAASEGVMLNRAVESNGTKQLNETWVLEVDIIFEASI